MERPWKNVELQAIYTAGKPGRLVVAEPVKLAPEFFPGDAAPRVYWIVNDSGVWSERGGHYHPEGGKRELLVAVSGVVEVELHSAAACEELVLVGASPLGLLIPNGVWHGVRIGPGSVLLSIASTLYAPDESVTTKPCRHP